MSDATTGTNMSATTQAFPVELRDTNLSQEGGVLFAEIAAPPMNLLGPELVRDLVSLIQRAEADERSGCSCSRAPTPTISSPMST